MTAYNELYLNRHFAELENKMDMSRMPTDEPDICITMTNQEAYDLHGMIWQAKSNANMLGINIEKHDLWIVELADVLDL